MFRRSKEENLNGYALGKANKVVLSDDCLAHIFTWVDDEILLFKCAFVCKAWLSLIRAHIVWSKKLEVAKVKVERPTELSQNYYRMRYLNHKYSYNLIGNNDGKWGLKPWKTDDTSDWRIENPPLGSKAVPEELHSSACFVATYFKCVKSQMITPSEIFPNDILKLKFYVEVIDWYGSRWDCGNRYSLNVKLLDKEDAIIDQLEFSDEIIVTESANNLLPEWRKVSYKFKPCRNVAKILFEHDGIDNKFWAGHYGTKITGSQLRLVFSE